MNPYQGPDHWSQRARKEGYPARSVYKLQELDTKFRLLRRSPLAVLDLGAAPGSWSLYVLRRGGTVLTSVDLVPLNCAGSPLAGARFRFIQGDFTSPEIHAAILEQGPFGLILSDAAPATTGNRGVDTLRSLALAEAALGYAEEVLNPGGALAVKVFQGGESGELLRRIGGLFREARSFKPRACRRESFETYFIGLGKKP